MPRITLLPLIVTGALALSACSPGDVELNGKLFDAVGVGSGSQGKSKTPVMAARAPLVVPPSMERLPPPETASVAPQDGAFPIDPEQRSTMSAGEQQRRQAEYCKEKYEKPLALGDQITASTARGPLGPCAPSILGLTGSNPLIQR